MSEFVIVFREVLEASLIVGIIYLLLEKSNQKSQLPKFWFGVTAAVISSFLLGFLILKTKSSIGSDSLAALFESIFLIFTAGLIWYVIFWLSKHVSDKNALEKHALQSMELSSWGIFLVVFFGILREGFETAIFLISSFSITSTFSYIGFFLGAFLAISIGYVIVKQGRKVNIRNIFKYTTLLLVFLASGMIAYGTHEMEEYLVKSSKIEKSEIVRVWDILSPEINADSGKKEYHPFHDKGSIGVFLKGFFGYNSNPNIPEVILWFISLCFGLNLWRKFYL
jgi:high-affinity iron transporter